MIIRIAELPIQKDWDYSMDMAIRAMHLAPLPDVIVLPELFTIGFVLDKISDQAISIKDMKELPLAKAASETGVWVIGGTFPVRIDRGIVNLLPVFDGEGKLVHTTEKVHLFSNMGEDSVFKGGIPSGVFDLKGVTAGASVCYDLRFPELFRTHALGGATIIFLPAQWPEPRLELFRSFLRARAGEAQVFFAGCNLGGDHLGIRFRGGGGIASPDGKMLPFREVNEYIKDYDVQMDEVERVRSRIACLEDRRPEVYGVKS
ncbi:MAG: carbon-nitrogen family hydrolase [Candidatus Sabulitectum sp.]|nr:carbon-nitrogen family hydrolase [Candidatus Sabulitectum sp.]